jgi:hypothetical protein
MQIEKSAKVALARVVLRQLQRDLEKQAVLGRAGLQFAKQAPKWLKGLIAGKAAPKAIPQAAGVSKQVLKRPWQGTLRSNVPDLGKPQLSLGEIGYEPLTRSLPSTMTHAQKVRMGYALPKPALSYGPSSISRKPAMAPSMGKRTFGNLPSLGQVDLPVSSVLRK